MPLGSIGAAIGAFGRIGAQGDANNAYQAASGDAMRYYDESFGRQKALYDPYTQVGNKSLADINRLQDQGYFSQQFGPQDLYSDPSYAFALNQGNLSARGAANARGGYGGGNVLAGLAKYGQGLASQQYQGAFERFQSGRNATLDRLGNLQQIGQFGVTGTNEADQWSTGNRANIRIGQGQSHAASILGAANARSAGYSALGSAGDSAAGLFGGWSKIFGL